MWPYPKAVLDDAKQLIFGYGNLRPRKAIENVLGICYSLFRVLWKPIIGDVENFISITKAAISLHNYLINEACYISRPMYGGMEEDLDLQESFLPFKQAGSINSIKTSK